MSRLTLRLPETLHRQLETQAKREGVSLNQYIVYALTQQASRGYHVTALPDDVVRRQTQQFKSLLERLGRANEDEVREVLEAREVVQPEQELQSEVSERLRRRMT